MTHDFQKSVGPRFRAHRGFTLVEMLVVIAIIGILAALTTVGVWAVFGNQQRRNTESTITTVNKVMQDHWKFVIEEARKETPSPAVQALAAPDPAGQRAKVLWIKFRLMEAFPQSYTEISAPFVYTLDPSNQPYIPQSQRRYITDYQNKLAGLNAGANNAATQSSACLLIALSANRGGAALSPDAIKYAVKDTDGDGISEITDGWNKPLAFTRFDVSPLVQQANPAAAGTRGAKFSDPVDPDGQLLAGAWYGSTSIYLLPATTPRAFFEGKFHPISATNGASANYVIPSIVSSGKDGVMQYPVTVPPSDDIISYQLRGN